MEWYLKVLRNYVNFSGRARRKEYWMFFLINIVVAFGLGLIDGVMSLRSSSGIGMLGLLYNLFILLPSIAVGARRLHDTGRSGWWQLIGLVPILGVIVLIVWYASEGASGSNAYGDDPKMDTGGATPAMA